jgi:site-specific recombinase XerD
VFLSNKAPFLPFVTSSAVSKIVRRAMNKLGIDSPRACAHLFRHSVATNMVCKGVDFKSVADILGHRSINTTEIYAKLNLESLSKVALPWPGEKI